METPNHTRERIVSAAERLFAEKGYQDTTVRDITEAAGVNVAAIHYHFGGKENLYLHMFQRHIAELRSLWRDVFAEVQVEGAAATLEATLRALVGACLRRILCDDEGGCFMRVMFREISQPGPAFELLFNEFIRPNRETLGAALARANPELSETRLTLCVASIMGLILHFVRARRVVSRLAGREYDDAFVEEICDHIVGFSLQGVGGHP